MSLAALGLYTFSWFFGLLTFLQDGQLPPLPHRTQEKLHNLHAVVCPPQAQHGTQVSSCMPVDASGIL